MESNKLKVCWLSAGVSSFIAGYLAKDSIGKFIYIDVEDQHPDSMRFIRDCEICFKASAAPCEECDPQWRGMEDAE